MLCRSMRAWALPGSRASSRSTRSLACRAVMHRTKCMQFADLDEIARVEEPNGREVQPLALGDGLAAEQVCAAVWRA